jgi:hypothetical protein
LNRRRQPFQAVFNRVMRSHLDDLFHFVFSIAPNGVQTIALKLALPFAQSAFSPLAAWLKMAVSIAPAAAMRSSLTLWV